MEERGPGGREGTASQGVPHHPEKTETPASLNVTAVFLASQSCFVALVPIYFNYPEIKKKKKQQPCLVQVLWQKQERKKEVISLLKADTPEATPNPQLQLLLL